MQRLQLLRLSCAFTFALAFSLSPVKASRLSHSGRPGITSYVQSAAASPQSTDANGSAVAEIDEETARKLVRGCTLPRDVSSPPSAAGSRIVLQFTVSEEGKLLTVHRIEGAFTHQLAASLAGCHFASYKVNGTKTAFRANISIAVK